MLQPLVRHPESHLKLQISLPVKKKKKNVREYSRGKELAN